MVKSQEKEQNMKIKKQKGLLIIALLSFILATSFTVENNQTPTGYFTVTTGKAISSGSFVISNFAPTLLGNIPDQTWDQGTSKLNAFDLDDYFLEPNGEAMSFTADGNSSIQITINSDNKVSFSQSISYSGTENVVFYASDGNSATASNTINLLVNNVTTQSCGNNVIEGTETCDGTSNSCSSGYRCKSDCTGCEIIPSTPSGGSSSSGGGGGGGGGSGGKKAQPPAEQPIEPITEILPDLEEPKISFKKAEKRIEMINCVNITRKESNKTIKFTESSTGIGDWLNIPSGFEIAVPPFKIGCDHDSMQITVTIPDDFINLQLLKCEGTKCNKMELKGVTERWCDVATGKYQGGEILEFNKSITVNTTINEMQDAIQNENTKVRIVGTKTEEITATLTTAEQSRQPENPNFRIAGTPIVIKMSKSNLSTILTMPYFESSDIEKSSYAIYGRKNDKWEYIGGEINNKDKTVTSVITNFGSYVNEKGEAEFAAIGSICFECLQSNLKKAFDPPGKDVGSIILVHGLGSSPETFNQIISDIKETGQPIQVWTFGYPSSKTIEENALDLADLLEANSKEFGELSIIAHSLGGLIAQKAIYDSYRSNLEGMKKYNYLDKLTKVVLIGAPNEGTPGIEFYRNIFRNFINEKTKAKLFIDPKSPVLDELTKGMITPQIPGVDYYVIAGTKPYEFNLVLFKVSTEKLFDIENDGFVTVKSAQHVGEEYLDDMCANYWKVELSHTELIDDPLAIKVLERIISKEIIRERTPVLGRQNYFEFDIDDCNPKNKYVIIGEKIAPELANDPTGCSCGNGYCGNGEDTVNCPADCARIITKENICRAGLGILMMLLLVLLAISAYYTYSKYFRKKELSKRWKAFIILYSLLIVVYLLQYENSCSAFSRVVFPMVLMMIVFMVVVFVFVPRVLNKIRGNKRIKNL